MTVTVEELGQLKYAEMKVSDFTIITGLNNSGKTYMTYALYGFLRFWQQGFMLPLDENDMKALSLGKKIHIDLNNYLREAQTIVDTACTEYQHQLHKLFASRERLFEKATFRIALSGSDLRIDTEDFNRLISSSGEATEGFSLVKSSNQDILTVSFFSKNTDNVTPDIPIFVIKRFIGNALKEILFKKVFPPVFISSAERTGIAFFEKELDFARKKLVDMLRTTERSVDLFDIVKERSSDYPWPVDDNVEFVRRLDEISNKESFLAKDYPSLIDSFETLVGGTYTMNQNQGVTFKSKGTGWHYTMGESASSVRSLLDLGFYLKHKAEQGDWLMIDEPEMNLHPSNQRKLARLLAGLVNAGIKILITTHSDFVIRELHNLILLNHRKDKPHIIKELTKENYTEQDLIQAKQLSIYVAEKDNIKGSGSRKSMKQTLISTQITDDQGIASTCFDDTITKLNRLEDTILYGEDYHDE